MLKEINQKIFGDVQNYHDIAKRNGEDLCLFPYLGPDLYCISISVRGCVFYYFFYWMLRMETFENVN